jgi:hypothetical protein
MTRLMQTSLSPLEDFIRGYVDARDGVWDEIEPQLYDLLIGPEIIEIAFDPEALPEHPDAQLASLGSPLLDRLLGDAARRWSSSRFYRTGLNLHPYSLETRLQRAIALPPGASISIETVRAMNFPQAIFWFKANFVSDQKEEEILRIGIDLHYSRETRNLELLLEANRLSEDPELYLPEAPHASLMAGYRAARKRAAPTVTALANIRRREWAGRVEKQIARMSAYYEQLRRESDERAIRAESSRANAEQVAESQGPAPADRPAADRAVARREAIDREERLRIAELRQKSAVHVQMSLANLMIVQQPKLLLAATVSQKNHTVGALPVVWDPLSEAIEAVPCPACGQPTFALQIDRVGLACPNCAGRSGRKV